MSYHYYKKIVICCISLHRISTTLHVVVQYYYNIANYKIIMILQVWYGIQTVKAIIVQSNIT